MQSNNKNSCCEVGCNLCSKQNEVKLQRRRKRDFSLMSIYDKDFSKRNSDNKHQESSPKKMNLRNLKNQSSNISGVNKFFFDLNSTYLANFNQYKNNPQTYTKPKKEESLPKNQYIQKYASHYTINYQKYADTKVQENYKISDPDFYNMKLPFAKNSEYTRKYKQLQMKNHIRIKDNENITQRKDNSLRLFETTQKDSYVPKKTIQKNIPILPSHNLISLPTTSFLYNTTYKDQFSSRKPSLQNDIIGHPLSMKKGDHF